MKNLIIVRGGGDLATGTIYKLYKCGFPVLVLEVAKPSAIRRNAAFSEAVYEGTQKVEDVTCYLADSVAAAEKLLAEGKLTMLVDPEGKASPSCGPLRWWMASLPRKTWEQPDRWRPSQWPLAPVLKQVSMWMRWWRPSGVTISAGFCGRGRLRPIRASPESLAAMERNG